MAQSTKTTGTILTSYSKDLIGSRVVRGPDWKWGKQDGISLLL